MPLQQIIVWWLLAVLLGWAAFPFSFWLFRRLPDRGYAFSRSLGLLAAGYVLWLGASLGLLQNDPGGICFALLSLTGLSAWLALRPAGSLAAMREFIRTQWKYILAAELLFGLCFVAWSGLRAFTVGKIMPVGGEKFMEMAFLNGILRSRQFPPLDPWLSGFGISYYYFGYVMMAMLTRLSGALSSVAFDLYDALLFALSALGAFGLVYNLVRVSRSGKRGAIPAGLLAALLTVVMGNLQGLVEALYSRGWLPAGLAEWLAIPNFPAQAQVSGAFDPGSFWGWAWRASRVINDLDLTGHSIALNPITEFPNFSFLLGDNHPHVLALPFALLAAAAALHLMLSAGEAHPASGGLQGRILLSAWIIGALIFLNTWDFPIYLGLAALAWLAGKSAADSKIAWPHLIDTARLSITLLLWAVLFYGLFLLGFSSQAGGILPYIFPPTRLAQYLVMFGPFILILAVFLPASFYRQNRAAGSSFSAGALLGAWLRLAGGLFLFFCLLLLLTAAALGLDSLRGGNLAASLAPYLGGGNFLATILSVLAQRLGHPWLFLLLTTLIFFDAAGVYLAIRRPAGPPQPSELPTPPDEGLMFARLLAFTGLALTFSLEFFYLRDSFGVRMNSVFKFYFQGWVLMACASAYGLWWIATRAARGFPRILQALGLAAGLLAILAGLVYPLMGVVSRTEGFSTPANLDGASELRRDHPEDWAVIDWLNQQGQTGAQAPVLLEAPGTSYTYAGRISAFTGFPTLLGWAGHELQWRGSYDEQGRRETVIAQIFTTRDPTAALQLLRGYGVDYVILGDTERAYIRSQCAQPEMSCDPTSAEKKFESILSPVFQQGATTLYAVPPP